MNRLSLIFLVLFIGSGCSTQTPVAAPVAPAPAKASSHRRQVKEPASFVLVWFDAKFYRSPRDQAPFQAYDFGPQGRAARAGQAFVMKVLEDRGDWIQVVDPREWLSEGRAIHCIGNGAFSESNFEITLWVRSTDLVPVLASKHSVRYDDSTFVNLEPGTPIFDGRPWANGYLFPLEIPAETVALRYQPNSMVASTRPAEFRTKAAAQVQLSLGGRPVQWQQPVWSYAPHRYLQVDSVGNRAYDEGGCGSFLLSVSADFTDSSSSIGEMLTRGAGQGRQDGIEIKKGGALWWPDRSSAGVVIKPFRRAGVSKASTGYTCLEVPLSTEFRTTGYKDDRVTVCVAPDSVDSITGTRWPRPDSREGRLKIVE